MKRRPEWLTLEIAFLLWVTISTDSFPSHSLPTSQPGFCHSNPSRTLYFSVLERQCALQSSRKTPSASTSLWQREEWIRLEMRNRNGNIFCLRSNLTTATSIEKSRSSNFLSVTHKKCSLDNYNEWRTKHCRPAEPCQDSLADALQ